MQTPTVKVTQNLDLIWRRSLESSSLTLEIRDLYTLSDCSPFWNQLKNEQLQTDNCQISQIFIFLCTFFNAFKDLSGYPILVQATRGIAFYRVQFYKFPGGGTASGANGARPPTEPLHPVLPNAIENSASEYKSISLQCQDPTSFPGRFSLAMQRKSTTETRLGRIERILSNLMKNQPKAETL